MKTYISAAHAGGQGKTTVAQMLYSLLQRRGETPKLVSADFQDATAQSKIGKFFPSAVRELGIGANLTSFKTENNPNAALRYWDHLGEILLSGGAVVDVGANVTSQLLQWGAHRRIAEVLRARHAPEIDLFVTTRAEKHAIENAASLIQDMVAQNVFPIANVYVVCNEVAGPFSVNQVSSAINRAAPERTIQYIALPRCTSELWEVLEKTNTPVEAALNLGDDEVCERLGVDVWTGSAGIHDLREWAETVFANFRKAGV